MARHKQANVAWTIDTLPNGRIRARDGCIGLIVAL